MKRLVLHIGTGKTGTSSIQNFLFENRSVLESQHRLFYPTEGLRSLQHFGEVIHAHYPIVDWILKKDVTRLARLRDMVVSNESSTCVVSSETLYHALKAADIAFAAEVFSMFEVQIVCYVRRQDLYMESAWKQQVKVGEMRMPFPAYLNRHTNARFLGEVHANYHAMLRPWAETFGRKSVLVRVFDRSQWVNQDLIDDFLTVCSPERLSAAYALPKATATNLAIPTELIRIMSKSNEMKLVPRSEQQEFAAFLQGLRPFKDTPLLSQQDRAAIMRNYETSNVQLFEEYMHRMPPTCFKTPLVEATKGPARPPAPLENVAVQSLVAAWRRPNTQATGRDPIAWLRGAPWRNRVWWKSIWRSKRN